MSLRNNLINWLVSQSKKKHSVLFRLIATAFGASLFLVGIPYVVYICGNIFSPNLIFPKTISHILASILFLMGFPWMLASVLWQLVYGKGTPVPAFPTKEFLKNGPYKYVRNPMMLGFFLYLTGCSFLFNHYSNLLGALFFIMLLLAELKFIEEPELEKRFGNAYSEYKKDTPLFIPQLNIKK